MTSRPPKSDAGLLSRPRDTILQRHAKHAVTKFKFHESCAMFNRVEASSLWLLCYMLHIATRSARQRGTCRTSQPEDDCFETFLYLLQRSDSWCCEQLRYSRCRH